MVTEARVQTGTTPTHAHVSPPGLELTVNKVTTNCFIKKLELKRLRFSDYKCIFYFFYSSVLKQAKFYSLSTV